MLKSKWVELATNKIFFYSLLRVSKWVELRQSKVRKSCDTVTLKTASPLLWYEWPGIKLCQMFYNQWYLAQEYTKIKLLLFIFTLPSVFIFLYHDENLLVLHTNVLLLLIFFLFNVLNQRYVASVEIFDIKKHISIAIYFLCPGALHYAPYSFS